MNIDSAKIGHIHPENYQGHCSICEEKMRLASMIIFDNGDIQNSKTEKIYTKYRLESPDGEYSIIAKVSEGLITLENKRGDKEFIFLKSKKEDLKAIAELFLKACEL